MDNYIHAYSKRESERLPDQAETLAELLHHDSVFPVKSKVLEAGCGRGTLQHVPAKRLNE